MKLFRAVDYFLKGFNVFFMSITVNTSHGTFIVPSEKEASLIMWLQQNAIKTNQQMVREQGQDQSGEGRFLINEGTFKGEF
jgi:hypothetical protein